MPVNPISTSPISIPGSSAFPGGISSGTIASPAQQSIFETFMKFIVSLTIVRACRVVRKQVY